MIGVVKYLFTTEEMKQMKLQWRDTSTKQMKELISDEGNYSIVWHDNLFGHHFFLDQFVDEDWIEIGVFDNLDSAKMEAERHFCESDGEDK